MPSPPPPCQCKGDDEEVVAVIAHELGHWKLGHTIQFFVLSQARTVMSGALMDRLLNALQRFVAGLLKA